jgi:hypothetical protein
VGPKTSRKRQFSRFTAGLRLKVRKGHSDESNALWRREHGTDQVEGDFMQPMPCLDRRFHRSAKSGQLKVGHLILTVAVRPREFAFPHQAQTSLAIAINPASI